MGEAVFDPNRRWSEDYPDLGHDPVPVEPCISEEYFELERERVFGKTWLCVGREEEIAKPGDYVVREVAACRASIILVRGEDGQVRGFHNVCSHRGNKLVWDERGSAKGKAFPCKFHGWTYGTSGDLKFVSCEEMFHDLDKREHGLVPVAVDTWQGFVFLNLDPKPKQSLREYLGGIGDKLSGFPYGEISSVYFYRTELRCNWKIALDAFSEGYHACYVHANTYPDTFTGGLNPHCHLPEVKLYRHHRSAAVWGNPAHDPPPVAKVAYRYGESVTKRASEDGMDFLPPGVNPTRSPHFAFDLNVIFPNFLLHLLPGMWFTHQFWPIAVDRTLWEGKAYWPTPRNAGERFAQEYNNVILRNAWLEDTATMEATHAALLCGAKKHFHFQEQEILLRHSYKVLEDFVGFYRRPRAAARKRRTARA